MASNGNEQSMLNQQVSFVQHYLTGLDAGGYKLQMQQKLLDRSGKQINDQAYERSYTFAVSADRFALSQPGNVIYSLFPAENASGEFSNVLPHVVFSLATFPWVRYPTNYLPYAPPMPGTDTDADVPTWLWVMLLDEDDVEACRRQGSTLDLSPATRTVADLFPQAALSGGYTSTLGEHYSYFSGARNVEGLEPGEQLDDVIQTIDVPLALFRKIAPTIADLKQMAHGRVVSMINQPTVAKMADPGEPNGTFSIVFGNRLPSDKSKSAAFLVSLEMLEPFLPPFAASDAALNDDPDDKRSLRLAVLRSWTFFTNGQPAHFVDRLKRLNGRAIDVLGKTEQAAANTNLRLSYTGANQMLQGAFGMGYVPLNETLRTSGKTVSWYRGALAPYAVAKGRCTPPLASPDAATIFDPSTGMFDTSYAVAWTIGRMIALQDDSFSSGYYSWKLGMHQQLRASIENQMLEQRFGACLDQASAARPQPANATLKAARGASSLLKRTILSLHPED